MNKSEKKKNNRFTIVREVILIITLLILFVVYRIIPSMSDIKYAKKAEIVRMELRELRTALEKYYQLTGKYPDLTKPGVSDDLRLLDYVDSEGRRISFADIYQKNQIGMTPASKKISNNNRVFDNNDFSKINGLAGWNYDYSGQTGEIHANLTPNTYHQGVDWSEE